MTYEEAIEVLETISELYPNKFELTERKARILIPKLKEMDVTRVLERLADFAAEHPFPPTISEIAAYPPEKNEHLGKMKEWEKEAANVPEDLKHQFRDKLNELVKEKSHDS